MFRRFVQKALKSTVRLSATMATKHIAKSAVLLTGTITATSDKKTLGDYVKSSRQKHNDEKIRKMEEIAKCDKYDPNKSFLEQFNVTGDYGVTVNNLSMRNNEVKVFVSYCGVMDLSYITFTYLKTDGDYHRDGKKYTFYGTNDIDELLQDIHNHKGTTEEAMQLNLNKWKTDVRWYRDTCREETFLTRKPKRWFNW